jgi:hypothetical protein
VERHYALVYMLMYMFYIVFLNVIVQIAKIKCDYKKYLLKEGLMKPVEARCYTTTGKDAIIANMKEPLLLTRR